MASVIRAWRVASSGGISEIPELSSQEQEILEKQVEDWIEKQPDILADDLLIVGRQVHTDSGWLDLLGITSDGRLMVIELKRDRMPRETVAQALDYASWLSQQTIETIEEIAQSHLKMSLQQAFRERFADQALELDFNAPSVRIVGARLDLATERMIAHLSNQYGMDIDGIVLRFLRLDDESRVITRISVNPEATVTAALSRRQEYTRKPEDLLAMAKSHGTVEIAVALRKLDPILQEYPGKAYGGSFRYRGSGRMLCGVNVANDFNAPYGALDVWVSHGSLSQITGIPEAEILQALAFPISHKYEKSHQSFYRLNNVGQARQFVELMSGWLVPEPESVDDSVV